MLRAFLYLVLIWISLFNPSFIKAQAHQSPHIIDSLNTALLSQINKLRLQSNLRIQEDSAKWKKLREELQSVKQTNVERRLELEAIILTMEADTKESAQQTRLSIDSLRRLATGFPVKGIVLDTLFILYSKIGETSAEERAKTITKHIKTLYDKKFQLPDSLIIVPSDITFDIVAGNLVVMSVSQTDAHWYNGGMRETAELFRTQITQSLSKGEESLAIGRRLLRLALGLGLLAACFIAIKLLKKARKWLLTKLHNRREGWLKGWAYKEYVILNTEQSFKVVKVITGAIEWLLILILVYSTLRVGFSISPYTRGWAERPFKMVLNPFLNIFHAIWAYLPNLFTILAIYLVIRYSTHAIKYVFSEIQREKLKINGFFPEWAMPTYSIIRFLSYAFMLVLIFPYLPGSDSSIFKGVSVFIGLLISFGSSSAIGNMIAGLVITYMRPFKIGDRIKVDDVTGDVIEKTLLVIRLRTPKNEIITLPNALILSKNTINYSTDALQHGLILHTTVTIGYNTPWKEVHDALITAAMRTEYILTQPAPFVLQTALNDSYVSYQINAYTNKPNSQAKIYSELHQQIQDACNEKGIEIMSPAYFAARDGNAITIPGAYVAKDYKAPGFNIKTD